MNTILSFYPTHCLHELGSDFANSVALTAQAKDALVGPVVLAAMASAVQGVVDICTPFHQVMPASLYVSVIAGSGLRKSTVMKFAFQGFRDFEAGFDGRLSGKVDFGSLGAHPYVWEDASESGITSLFGNGAKAAAMVMDEGGMLEARLNNQTMCKRFDGSPLRVIRKDQITQIRDTRTTFCMTVQDAVFAQLLKGKEGSLMVASGLMARNLISYATHAMPHLSFNRTAQNPNEHGFHDRVRELMNDYSRILQTSAPRTQIRLSSEAEQLWREADTYWKALPSTDEAWAGMDSFAQRAGEQALRIAAILQWFTDPQLFIERRYIESAAMLVEWHLEQALAGFGEPSQETLQIHLGNELYTYLVGKWKKLGQGAFLRVDLLRKGPASLRKAASLDLAIEQLLLERKVSLHPEGLSKQLLLNLSPDFINRLIPKTVAKGVTMSAFLK